MSIKIEQVNVKNLGPLSDFPCSFKPVNLIYGHNEHGKTYLVEFIYKSLFKNIALSLRNNSASGQVIVSGLEEKETLFSPAIKKKLEDFWEDGLPGLPRDFSKLLVVKGADLDFSSSNSAGIDDKILKEFLSGEGLLEILSSRITSTESSATYENGRISGQNRGKVKEYYESQARIKQLDDYIQRVNENISGGKRYELSQKIEEIKKQKEDQEHARRHLAFNLAAEIDTLKGKFESLPDETLSHLDKLIEKHLEKNVELEKQQHELEKNREKSKDYLWLDAALNQYKNLVMSGNSLKPRPGFTWLLLSIFSISLAILLVLIRQPYLGAGVILLSVFFGFLYIRTITKSQTNLIQQHEIEKIVSDYKDRFGGSAVVQEATLVAKQKELQPVYFSIEKFSTDIQTIKSELKDIEKQIIDDFKKFPVSKSKKNDWQSSLKVLQETRAELDDQFREKEKDLSRLDIDESEFIKEPVGAKYDSFLLKTLTNDLEELENQIDESEAEIRVLKQEVCAITRADPNISWDELVEVLDNKRQDEVNSYKSITADLIARIKVNEVLNEMRAIEQERIEEGLSSNAICQALYATTGHYDRVEKEGEELYVADQYGRYRVADLSTGAREQVLLGLRIGFAAMLLAGTPLFLILDDAFQHSDWERRERLVNKLFDLSKEGWQIIYFTMDDHIRSLFESTAKKSGKVQYQTIELPEMN